MKIPALDKLPIAIVSLRQSSAVNAPVRNTWASILPSAQSIRMTSCSAPISRLKIATFSSVLVATFCATFSAKAVLPTEGRAATIIKSLRWKPAVILSKSRNPVGTPVISPFRA